MSRRGTPTALRSRSFRSDLIAWAACAVLLVAATIGARAWLHRRVRVDRPGAGGSVAYRLPVLAWERVGPHADGAALDPARLAEQLDALAAAGFTPVSLRQVRDAYLRGATLPERAVLLTFDGGHLSTYQAVDALLRRRGWPAVMFLDPRPVEERDATYVYWDRLRRMVDSGIWELGTYPARPAGPAVLRDRLAGYEVLASLSGGAGESASDSAPLAFENSLFGVNDREADPRRLFRVHVQGEWSGAELVRRLEYSVAPPAAASCAGAPPVPPARWVPGAGRLAEDAGSLRLVGSPRGEAWLAGGEWARDFVLELEVRPEEGPFWIVQQAIGSREQWRWGGTSRTLFLQRLRPGSPVEVLASVERPTPRGTWHHLRLVKRGTGVWVEWDGERVAELPRSVDARWRGNVGISTGGAKEAGAVSVRSVRFAAIPYRLVPVSGAPAAAEIRDLLRDGACLAAISPPGLFEGGGPLRRAAADADLLAMVAAKGAWDLVPAVEIASDALAPEPGRADAIAEVAAREGWAGLRLVPGRGVAGSSWKDAAVRWSRLLGERDVRVFVDEEGWR